MYMQKDKNVFSQSSCGTLINNLILSVKVTGNVHVQYELMLHGECEYRILNLPPLSLALATRRT